MSRRKTVQINFQPLKSAIDKAFRGNNTSFCIAMGFENRTSWVSDLKRGRNLPSPEEAAKMCLLLNTTPEEIMLTQGGTDEETAKLQADIQTVKDLIEQQRAEQGIKKDPAGGGALNIEGIERIDPEILHFLLTCASKEMDATKQFVRSLANLREPESEG